MNDLKMFAERWRTRKYEQFWDRNSDRRYMRQAIYPSLSRWLTQRPSPRVLDIGSRWYSTRVRRHLTAPDLQYWVVEPARRLQNPECDRLIRESVIGLETRHPETRGSFDCVISCGVLGYVPFSQVESRDYLRTAQQLLKPGGRFLLKIDEVCMAKQRPEKKFTREMALNDFALADDLGLEADHTVSGEGEVYRFLVLRPK